MKAALKGIFSPPNHQDTKKRANQMIMTRLQDKESLVAFCLATYHMPCQFRVPEVLLCV